MKIKIDRKRSSFFPQSQGRREKSKIIPIGGRKDEQSAKKVVSDSPGLVDFAIGLVNSVINLPAMGK